MTKVCHTVNLVAMVYLTVDLKATENTDRMFYNIMLKIVPVIIWALMSVSKILRSGSADGPFSFNYTRQWCPLKPYIHIFRKNLIVAIY